MAKPRIENRPCCLCVRLGLGETPAEFHHIREGRQGVRGKKGIPLCYPHHRGHLGVHTLGKRAWAAKFGVTEMELFDNLENK